MSRASALAAWVAVEKSDPLVPGECQVWWADCSEFGATDTPLSAEEWARAERYASAERRIQFVLGRALLRERLSFFLGCAPDAVNILLDPSGKPRLDHERVVTFNLAHSGSIVVAAFRLGGQVGIDVERIDRQRPWRPVAEAAFTREEIEAIESAPESARIDRFFETWTAAEAMAKATGGSVFEMMDARFRPARPPVVLRPPMPSGYCCALVDCGESRRFGIGRWG